MSSSPLEGEQTYHGCACTFCKPFRLQKMRNKTERKLPRAEPSLLLWLQWKMRNSMRSWYIWRHLVENKSSDVSSLDLKLLEVAASHLSVPLTHLFVLTSETSSDP